MATTKNVQWHIAPFQVAVTPPVGHSLAYGVNTRVDSPLYVRGVVIDDGRTRAVLASVDFTCLAGRAHRNWKNLIARAAGAPPKQVFLHTVHQHDSLYVGLEADALIREFGFEPKLSASYWAEISAKLERAIRQAVQAGRRGNWRAVRQLATAERRLAGLASNRRLLDKHGKVWATRVSMCHAKKLQREPVGLIDPFLRTIAFLGSGGRLIAALHFYATHPQVAYLRNMAGSDVPGVALRHAEAALGGQGAQIYFTGCGANATMGKYSFAEKEKSLRVLGRRLGEGLLANLRRLEEQPLGRLAFTQARFNLPLDRRFTEKRLRGELRKAATAAEAHFLASKLILLRNWQAWRQPAISRVSFGPQVHFLSFPAEPVVEYQLYAQALIPEHFLAVAAYGEYNHFYLPTAAMYAEGGYEPATGLYTPELEAPLKNAIAKVLARLR